MQLCYYQERIPLPFHVSDIFNVTQGGIGTYFQPGVVSPFFRFAARILDEALAWYLSEHIMDGYKFLMQNYHEGDSVCIFGSFIFREPSSVTRADEQLIGFSRGAYTARALAGMLHKVAIDCQPSTITH